MFLLYTLLPTDHVCTTNRNILLYIIIGLAQETVEVWPLLMKIDQQVTMANGDTLNEGTQMQSLCLLGMYKSTASPNYFGEAGVEHLFC